MTAPLHPALARAIDLSIAGVDQNLGGPFGAVITKDGELIASGQNRVTSSGDPTAHAEIVAIRAACAALGTHSLAGCEIFSSCEPCPMCLAAIHWARLNRLTFAAGRDDAARAGFDDELLYRELVLPIERRSVPTVQVGREAALVAFQRWDAKEDRIPY
ncbi:MAG: nucleoside deaminase [Planctomycetes bacterium]|nr:nucleoside deaminase [Planctomycetota bacterium]MCB9904737.1 nucleoside deaminase [Planctomycetota bacterium]